MDSKMYLRRISHHFCSRTLTALTLVLVGILLLAGSAAAESASDAASEVVPPQDTTLQPAPQEVVQPAAAVEKRGYSGLDLSFINFEAEDISGADAAAYGLVFVGGYRFGEYFSLEGAINFLPLADSYFLLPIPMMWAPAEDGIYLNLATGMRLNIVEQSSHNVIPWVSLWYTGHALLGDFDVAGVGFTYGAGLEWKKKNGKRGRLSVRLHNFDGDLEIEKRNVTTEYGRTDVKAIEVSFTLFGG